MGKPHTILKGFPSPLRIPPLLKFRCAGVLCSGPALGGLLRRVGGPGVEVGFQPSGPAMPNPGLLSWYLKAIWRAFLGAAKRP